MNLSAYYNRTGDPEKALEYARQALALDPKSDRAWFQEGRPTSARGASTRPSRSLNQAISFNPRASSYYYVLAGVYRRLGRTDESRKALEAFQKLERETDRAGEEARAVREPGRD